MFVFVFLAGALWWHGMYAWLTRGTARRDNAERHAAESARLFEAMRQTLDAVTDETLCLCRTPADLPPTAPFINGFPAPTFCVTEVRQLSALRALVRREGKRAGLTGGRLYNLIAAASEAAMNAQAHGRGTGRLSLHPFGAGAVGADLPSGLWVRIEDRGPGIPLGNLPQATLKKGYSTGDTAGLGWKMMIEHADRVHLFTEAGSTVVVLTMFVTDPPARALVNARMGCLNA